MTMDIIIALGNVAPLGPGLDVYRVQRNYRKVSNIRRTKSQNLNASRLIL